MTDSPTPLSSSSSSTSGSHASVKYEGLFISCLDCVEGSVWSDLEKLLLIRFHAIIVVFVGPSHDLLMNKS